MDPVQPLPNAERTMDDLKSIALDLQSAVEDALTRTNLSAQDALELCNRIRAGQGELDRKIVDAISLITAEADITYDTDEGPYN